MAGTKILRLRAWGGGGFGGGKPQTQREGFRPSKLFMPEAQDLSPETCLLEFRQQLKMGSDTLWASNEGCSSSGVGIIGITVT